MYRNTFVVMNLVLEGGLFEFESVCVMYFKNKTN